MNSKERVTAAIKFLTPDRLPVDIPVLGLSDFYHVGWKQIGTGDRAMLRTVDEWGCVWGRTEMKNMGQVIEHPLNNWSDLDHFRWPNPDDPSLYDGMEERLQGAGDRFVMTGLFMVLFERLHALRGFQNTLEDLYLERENIEMLADRIVEYDLRVFENIAARLPGAIDGIQFTDDWGTELNSFISPALFDALFKPRYRRIFDACHANDWSIILHSCGKVDPLLESWIDVGLDAVNLQQPRVFDIEGVGRQFAGRICFSSLCDIQHTLPFKGKAEIEEEAALLLKHWTTPQGGFILSDYGDGEAIGVAEEKKRWMLDAFLANDPWIAK